MTGLQILTGDCRAILPTLDAGSVQCCISSPPYWGLRDYGTAQWEGGNPECDHKFDHSKRESKAYNFLDGHGREGVKACTSWTTRSESEFHRDCPCGARRIDSQLGLEVTPDCGKQGFMRLRPDLTDEQREYVVRRLLGVFDRDAARNGKDNKA